MDGVAEVNTKMPSDVAALPSVGALPEDCRKNPLLRLAVTKPSVITSWPSYADSSPLPWITPIEVITTSSFTIVPKPTPSPMEAPAGLLSVTKKVSLISSKVSPNTDTGMVALLAPWGIVSAPLAAVKSTPEVAESLLVA